jgi:hypothetical protein
MRFGEWWGVVRERWSVTFSATRRHAKHHFGNLQLGLALLLVAAVLRLFGEGFGARQVLASGLLICVSVVVLLTIVLLVSFFTSGTWIVVERDKQITHLRDCIKAEKEETASMRSALEKAVDMPLHVLWQRLQVLKKRGDQLKQRLITDLEYESLGADYERWISDCLKLLSRMGTRSDSGTVFEREFIGPARGYGDQTEGECNEHSHKELCMRIKARTFNLTTIILRIFHSA